MRAAIRDTEIYFDIEGAGLVPDGQVMREKPPAFLIHGGPGGEHGGFKPGFSPLAEQMQLVYFDHRGQGRSARGDKQSYTLDNNVEDMEALRRIWAAGRLCPSAHRMAGWWRRRMRRGIRRRCRIWC